MQLLPEYMTQSDGRYTDIFICYTKAAQNIIDIKIYTYLGNSISKGFVHSII